MDQMDVSAIAGKLIDPNVNGWAQEATLRKVTKLLSKQTAQVEDSTDDIVDAIYDSSTANSAAFDKLRHQIERTNRQVKNSSNSGDSSSGISELFSEGIKKATGLLGMFAKALSSIGGFIVNSVITAFKLLKDHIIAIVDTFMDLAEYGFTAGQSMSEFAGYAGISGLGLRDFAEITKQHASVVQLMTTKIGDGVKRFSGFTRQVNTAITNVGVLGMTTKETAEYAADYLEIQRRAGLLNSRTEKQQRDSAVEFIKNMNAYTKIMGKSRKQIAKDAAEMLSVPEMSGYLATASEASRKSAEQASTQLASLQDSNGIFTKMYQSALITGRTVTDGTSAWAAMIPGVDSAIKEMATATRNGADTSKATEHLVKSLSKVTDDQIKTITVQAATGNENVQALMATIGAYRNMTAQQKKDMFDNTAKQSKMAQAISQINRILEGLQNKLVGLFDLTILNYIEKNLDGLAGIIGSVASRISAYFDDLINAYQNDPQALLTQFWEDATKSIGDVLVPMLKKLGGYIVDTITPGINSASEASMNLDDTLNKFKKGDANLGDVREAMIELKNEGGKLTRQQTEMLKSMGDKKIFESDEHGDYRSITNLWGDFDKVSPIELANRMNVVDAAQPKLQTVSKPNKLKEEKVVKRPVKKEEHKQVHHKEDAQKKQNEKAKSSFNTKVDSHLSGVGTQLDSLKELLQTVIENTGNTATNTAKMSKNNNSLMP